MFFQVHFATRLSQVNEATYNQLMPFFNVTTHSNELHLIAGRTQIVLHLEADPVSLFLYNWTFPLTHSIAPNGVR